MNIYEARWENAKKKCAKIQTLLSKGYLIFDKDGDTVLSADIKSDYYFEVNLNLGGCVLFCVNDSSRDDGILDTIKEFNNKFAGWKYVHTKNVKKGI